MKTITRLLLGMIIFAVVSAIAPENAMAQKKAPPKLYKPPLRGAPVSRVGGGIPGPGDNKPSLHVLAPSHTGFTLVEQPDLYWYLSKRAQHPIEIIINDEINVEPMLEFRLNPPIQAGLHRIQLAKHGTRLLPGTTYEWFVSIVTDSEDPSQEIVAGGTIQHAAPNSSVRQDAESAMQNAAGADSKWRRYAASGIWYDAVAALSSRMDQRPEDKALQQQFANLLDEVELAEPAAYLRQ